MIAKKGEFYSGAGMMVVFVVILIVMFMPIFKGHNGLDYLDSLYNSISKGSAYYIPAMQDEAKTYAGSNVKLTLTMQDETQARGQQQIDQIQALCGDRDAHPLAQISRGWHRPPPLMPRESLHRRSMARPERHGRPHARQGHL